MSKLPDNLRLTVPMFSAYEEPEGYLVRDPACHGLMYYTLIAMRSYTQVMEDHVLDDAPDPYVNFRELFKSIAKMYGVTPENLATFWPNVRLQFKLLDLGDVPRVVQDAESSRFMRGSNDAKLLTEGMDPGIDFEEMMRTWKKVN